MGTYANFLYSTACAILVLPTLAFGQEPSKLTEAEGVGDAKGSVVDAETGDYVSHASVKLVPVRALEPINGSEGITDEKGHYRTRAPLGTFKSSIAAEKVLDLSLYEILTFAARKTERNIRVSQIAIEVSCEGYETLLARDESSRRGTDPDSGLAIQTSTNLDDPSALPESQEEASATPAMDERASSMETALAVSVGRSLMLCANLWEPGTKQFHSFGVGVAPITYDRVGPSWWDRGVKLGFAIEYMNYNVRSWPLSFAARVGVVGEDVYYAPGIFTWYPINREALFRIGVLFPLGGRFERRTLEIGILFLTRTR